MLMGINLGMLKKVKPTPKKDIEFVLVDKPGTPRDPNTKTVLISAQEAVELMIRQEKFQCHRPHLKTAETICCCSER